MAEPLRVLHIVTVMDYAGAETMLMNYFRHIDRNRVQFDFLTHRMREGAYDREIRALGGRVYHTPPLQPQTFFAYCSQIRAFFAGHREFRVVHAHLDALSAFALGAAGRAGVPVRIAHSHTTRFDRDWKLPLRLAARPLLARSATDFWGCSTQALRFMFGPAGAGGFVLRNAIDTGRFGYQEPVRRRYRRELGLERRFAVGHVGRFIPAKNHLFLLEVFASLRQREPSAVLLLAGQGEGEAEAREKVRRLGLRDSVRFLGTRSDVAGLMQAMDAFVLPSVYEGIPVVGVEAQAAGLPCFFSDAVSREADLGRATHIGLSQPPQVWAERILGARTLRRSDGSADVAQAGYSIEEQSRRLEEKYLSFGI